MQNCEVSGKIMSMHESGIFEHEAADSVPATRLAKMIFMPLSQFVAVWLIRKVHSIVYYEQ